MMDTEYDFTQTVNTSQLLDEINTSGISAPDYILTSGTFVQIFYVNPLSDTDLQTLTTVVANHVANPNYVTIAMQAQINTLVGYLNNSNTTVSNEARAIIVASMASRMSFQLLCSINNQIAAALNNNG